MKKRIGLGLMDKELALKPLLAGPTVVTIGNFDGLHLGHQNLVAELLAQSHRAKQASAVFTFDPHPLQVLRPDRGVERIFPREDLAEQLESRGVDALVQFRFDHEFSCLSPQDFLAQILVPLLNPNHLVVGYDFSFGKDKSGNLVTLKEECRKRNWGLTIVEPFLLEEKVVSSSRIRDCLKLGDAEEARLLLGRPYYIRGKVFRGQQRGRTIGVPTANLDPVTEFIPRVGVYFTRIYVRGQAFKSITNVGFNPTFESIQKLRVESHIFDFNQDIYGDEVRVELLKFHRDEKRFSGIQELKQQIEMDIQSAKDFFQENWS